ncbi:hypothetical protein GGS21DRAFT_213301 [Xylaria nigripes]|nr:hypothetical protein GGS21DRAFT_213301 [Xylaria nigripes]
MVFIHFFSQPNTKEPEHDLDFPIPANLEKKKKSVYTILYTSDTQTRSNYVMDDVGGPLPTSLEMDEKPRCLYSATCDTGSSLRKAISHIFGRNKLCTRKIPQFVWVHYCRKHYQRSRYRNGAEYTRIQCDLVLLQLNRLQAWSDRNKNAGRPGVVQSWSLALRKRESNRLQGGSMNEGETDSSGNSANSGKNAVINGTAVPDWLRAKCRDGYSTQEIEAIVKEIQGLIDQGQLSQIPDIEFLPNISREGSAEYEGTDHVGNGMDTIQRAAHSRTTSVDVTAHAHAHVLSPRRNHTTTGPNPNYWRPDNPALSPNHQQMARSNGPFNGTDHMSERIHPGGNIMDMGSILGEASDLSYHPSIPPQPQNGHVQRPYRGPGYSANPYNGAHNPSSGPSTLPSIQYLIDQPLMPEIPLSPTSPQPTTHQRSMSGYCQFPQNPEYNRAYLEFQPQYYMQGYSESTPPLPGPLQRRDHSAMLSHNYSLSQSHVDAPDPYMRQPVPLVANHSRHQSAPHTITTHGTSNYNPQEYEQTSTNPYFLPRQEFKSSGAADSA